MGESSIVKDEHLEWKSKDMEPSFFNKTVPAWESCLRNFSEKSNKKPSQ